MTAAGGLRERVAFDVPVTVDDGAGGRDRTWQEVHTCAAEFRYERGQEAREAGGVTGTAVFRVVVRSSQATRALTSEDRMRDVREDVAFNIRDVDHKTHPAWVFLRVEKGVAI